MLAPEPDAFDVDGLGEVPDLLWGIDGVGVVSMHDACVVEHDVYAAPRVEMVDQSFDIGFLGDIADLGIFSGVQE